MLSRVIECVGIDVNGIPRVWGRGPSPDKAVKECKAEALSYVRRRPDAGPLLWWSFSYE